jgi:hypothetical protein
MAFSADEIRRNFAYWNEWFPAAEAAELANRGGASTVFYRYTGGRDGTGARRGEEVTGREVLEQQRRFVENVRVTNKQFETTKFRKEQRRGRDGKIRTVRVKNITEGMKRTASRRRGTGDDLKARRKAEQTGTAGFRAWLMIYLPGTDLKGIAA